MRNFIKQFLIIFCLVPAASCQKDTKSVGTKLKKDSIVVVGSPNYSFQKEFEDEALIKNLTEKVVIHGDTAAFKHLQAIYVFSGHENELLYYSYIMAEEFGYPEGYYQTYSILKTDIRNDNNKKRNALADYYLLKAYESGYRSAVYSLDERFKTKNPPKATEYWKTIAR